MIERPRNLIYEKCKIEFNYRLFDRLEINLVHINKNRRSNFSPIEIHDAVIQFVGGRYLKQSTQKFFGVECCSYFVVIDQFKSKLYKLVFCICSDRTFNIGVITFHRTKEK